MATLYPAQGIPSTIQAPEGGFTALTISNLIGGDPFYDYVESTKKVLGRCEGAYTLGMPINQHGKTFLRSACGDILEMEPGELARTEYDQVERWASDIPEVMSEEKRS